MFNVGTGELIVILLVALVVLGPTKLPSAARQAAQTMTELRKISTGFQREMRAAMDEAIEADARQQGAQAVAEATHPELTADGDTAEGDTGSGGSSDAGSGDSDDTGSGDTGDTGSGTGDPLVSTAEAAGMYEAGRPPESARPDEASADHS